MIKIRNYTNEDIEYIKNNYNELTTKQIAQVLNKSESSIYNAIRKLGLKKQIHKSWSDAENLFLEENYENLDLIRYISNNESSNYDFCKKFKEDEIQDCFKYDKMKVDKIINKNIG